MEITEGWLVCVVNRRSLVHPEIPCEVFGAKYTTIFALGATDPHHFDIGSRTSPSALFASVGAFLPSSTETEVTVGSAIPKEAK